MTNPEFWQRFTAQYGSDVADRFRDALSQPAQVSIRINERKAPPHPSPLGEGASPLRGGLRGAVPWCSTGFYLSERPAFTFDPLLHAGVYYVQEASSMFLEQAIRQHAADARMALDLCAAPGGKSTLARSLLPDDCLLISNEPIGKRAAVLAENMAKWGHPNCMVTQNYPKHFDRYTDTFDLIIADVPCSGEGMFRREPEAVAQWCPQLVEQCAALQRSIIEDVWPALRPGGVLIYSTCTYNHQEDEDNVEWICRTLGADILPIGHPADWGIVGQHHFIPGTTRGEGFFLCALRKAPPHPSPLGEGANTHGFPPKGGTKGGFEALNVIHRGWDKVTMKGKVEIPSPTIALSIEPHEYPTCEVDAATALAYLRGESICIDAPRGFVVITHRGHGLGFVKNLGNRANNLYPDAWRIRSQHGTPCAVIPELE